MLFAGSPSASGFNESSASLSCSNSNPDHEKTAVGEKLDFFLSTFFGPRSYLVHEEGGSNSLTFSQDSLPCQQTTSR